MSDDLIRLPCDGPVSVSADGGRLIFTIPAGDDANSIERCDQVAKGLLETCGEFDDFTKRFGFYFATPEHDFLARKIRSQHWDGIVLVKQKETGNPLTIDLGGPFDIVVHHQIGILSLLVGRVRRQ